MYANFVSTVSPNHAAEARNSDGAFGLADVLFRHQRKFGGVLNGIDYDVWNPEIDRFIPGATRPGASMPSTQTKSACGSDSRCAVPGARLSLSSGAWMSKKA